MAVTKPTKPNVTLPEEFGGIKTPFNESQVKNGYEDGIPQIVDGGNINYQYDALFKNNKYIRTVTDTIVDMPIGNTLVIDTNNRLDSVPAITFEEYE